MLWSKALVAHTKSNPTSKKAVTRTLKVGLNSEYKYHWVSNSRMLEVGSRSTGFWRIASASWEGTSNSTARGNTSLLMFKAMAANSRLLTLRSRKSRGISSVKTNKHVYFALITQRHSFGSYNRNDLYKLRINQLNHQWTFITVL